MRILKVLLLFYGCVLVVRVACAGPLSFPDHNFSIEIPLKWAPITPKPPEMVVAVQNIDGSKTLPIAAKKLPENERPTGPKDFRAAINFRAGLKDSMIAQGWKFDAEQKVESGDLSFVSLIAHRASNKHSMIAYTIVVDVQAYALMFLVSESVTTDDSEVRSIFRSFRLLSNKV